MKNLLPRKRTTAAVLALVALVSAACVKQKPPGVAIKSLKSDIVFGLNPPAVPASALPPIDQTDLGVPDLAAPPKLPRLLPPVNTPACPQAGITDAPAKIAGLGIDGQPAVGEYRWKVGGELNINGVKLPVPSATTFDREIINVTPVVKTEVPIGGDPVTQPITTKTFSYTLKTHLNLPGQPDQGTQEATYQVKDNPLAIPVGTSTANIGKPVVVGDPVRGIALTGLKTTLADGTSSTFTPTPGVLLLPLQVNPGEYFESVGVDPASGAVLINQGIVDKRVAVDACGDLVDGWRVNARQTFVGLAGANVAEYDYEFATQLGGMLVYEKIGPPDLTNTPLPPLPFIPGSPTPNIPSVPTTLPPLPVSLPGTTNTYEYTLGQLTPSPLFALLMLARIAPRNSARRQLLLWAGIVALLFLYTQVYLVGDSRPGRGTPMAIVFNGFVIGAINALTAAGLILVYRASRIINFAQAAIGLVAGVFVVNMVGYNPGFPFPLTVLIGLVGAGLSGAAIELIFGRRFANAPRLVLTVVTIAGSGFLALISASFVDGLGIFPPRATHVATDLASDRIRSLLPFSGFHFRVGSSHQQFGFPEVFAIEVAVLCLVGLAIFFRYTRAGTAIRAAAENTERAALLGIGVGGLGTLVWIIAGVLSGFNITADALLGDPAGLSRGTIALFAPIAAAILARMKSIPTAVAVSIMIGIVIQATDYTWSGSFPAVSVGLFIAVCGSLLLQRRRAMRESLSDEESAWQATEEPRPIPAELRNVGALHAVRYSLLALGLAVVIAAPFMFAIRIQFLLSVIALLTIVGLSLVVLTGWAGQVSLGQFGFVAVGAIAAGKLAVDHGWSFWLAVPAATIITAIVAGLIGLPALRIRGLYLAVVTFAFAVAVSDLVSSPRYFRDDLPRQVPRPTLFFLDFNDDRSMYFMCVVALALSVVVVINLRRSRFGRLLIAARENEANVQAFGVPLLRLKLLAFITSGALAGFAGGIYAFQQRGVSGDAFAIDKSFNVFVVTIVGGISSAGGALLGSAYGNFGTYFFQSNQLSGFIIGLLPLVLLYIEPGGLIAIVNQIRDSWLRIIAQRRQIVVPSLFADYDADMIERRLIPLTEASPGEGLGALPAGDRYALESELHGDGRGQLPGQRENREVAAIAAASGEDAGS